MIDDKLFLFDRSENYENSELYENLSESVSNYFSYCLFLHLSVEELSLLNAGTIKTCCSNLQGAQDGEVGGVRTVLTADGGLIATGSTSSDLGSPPSGGGCPWRHSFRNVGETPTGSSTELSC